MSQTFQLLSAAVLKLKIEIEVLFGSENIVEMLNIEITAHFGKELNKGVFSLFSMQ